MAANRAGSLSWLLNMFGLRGVFNLVLGQNTIDDTQLMQQQMAMQMGGPGQDANKMFGAEKQALEMTGHMWVLPMTELRAEKVLTRELKRR